MRLRAGLSGIAALCFSTSAAAAEAPWSAADVNVGAHAGWIPTNVCRQTLSDVVQCSAMAFAGFGLGSRYWLSKTWTLGVVGSWAARGFLMAFGEAMTASSPLRTTRPWGAA
jgi:hypothetical protein